MKSGASFFKSKIGRRFFLLFLFCAFFPTIVMIGVSYERVSRQLEEQSLLRLQKETKSYGLALFDRLVRMENLLNLYGFKLFLSSDKQLALDEELKDQMAAVFNAVYLLNKEGEYKVVFGLQNEESLDEVISRHKPDKQRSQILHKHNSNESHVPVYMFVPLKKNPEQEGFLVAEIDLGFLWGIGSVLLLPAMTDLAVDDYSGSSIVRTNAAPIEESLWVPRHLDEADMRLFEYEHGGILFHASSWVLFLPSLFDTLPWTIVLGQSENDMLAPMKEFKRMFPLVIILALLTILFFSMHFLRKTLAPLSKLQEATKRIAGNDFTGKVAVYSGDEFEELANSFNSMTTQLNKQFNALSVIDKIDRAILSSLNTSDVVSTALHMMRDFFHADVIVFARSNPQNLEILELAVLEKGLQVKPDWKYTDISHSERGNIFRNNEYNILDSQENIPRFLSPFAVQDTSFLSLPLFMNETLAGTVIMSLRVTDPTTMNLRATDPATIEEEIKQARQITDQLAIALANARLVQDLESLSLGTVEALARTVDAKSEWTAGHSERVAKLSVKIGKVMGLATENIELLYRGGLLHDIGKIGVPISILDKPDKLDEEEFNSVRSHPLIGEKILEPIDVYKDILPIVVQHHERFDGKGYPHGLAGTEIHINARILAVADVYDALVSQRPYREGWVKEKVLGYIKEQTGQMFDPKVVDCFMVVIS